MTFCSKKGFSRLIRILCVFLFIGPVFAKPVDEIDFFNVGQGHAVLIRKVGTNSTTGQPYTPLLIDAGSTSYPLKMGKRYDWIKDNKSSLSLQILNKILNFWKESHGNQLRGGMFNLNVIVTHPDKDHQEFIPSILEQLRQKSKLKLSRFTFSPSLLLGGKEDLYFRIFNSYKCLYSVEFPGIFLKNSLDFLATSGCITHLFCPKGTEKDTNGWSIVTRIQVDEISAIFTGDADITVKKSMLTYLSSGKKQEAYLQSDILLVSHHGAERTYFKEWDEAVNPRAIIIGAGLHKYEHPKGITIREYLFLLNREGRLWKDKVMSHGIQYHCEQTIQDEISQIFKDKGNRLLDNIPLSSEVDGGEGSKRWHLAWTDVPIYTLWTTGNLIFKKDVRSPKFLDAPYGLSPYIAVPDPLYLFDPHRRESLTPLSEKESTAYAVIPDLIREINHNDKEEISLFSTLSMNELLLIQDHADRELYLQTLERIFRETEPYVRETESYACDNTLSFQWLREAVVKRSRDVPENEERLKNAANLLFRNRSSGLIRGKPPPMSKIPQGMDLERNIYVFKTFLKSYHPLYRLESYVNILSSITKSGPSEREIEVLCPFGFPEWFQLEKLVKFVREEIITPSKEFTSLGDIVDILPWRLQGKNFKEIAQDIVNSEGFIKVTQKYVKSNPANYERHPTTLKGFHQKIEEYFLQAIDEYLT